MSRPTCSAYPNSAFPISFLRSDSLTATFFVLAVVASTSFRTITPTILDLGLAAKQRPVFRYDSMCAHEGSSAASKSNGATWLLVKGSIRIA